MIQTNPISGQIPVFILAGGLGTRLSEETQLRPKPMVEVGETPILVHIMRWYYAHGFNDFVICAGYKSWEIKNYFLNYEFRQNHLGIDHRLENNAPPKSFGKNNAQENWRVRVLDTGLETMTGARLANALDTLKDESFENFALTYGDGVSNVDLKKELEFHLSHKKLGTVLGVRPSARFGALDVDEKNNVNGFLEKPEDSEDLINGGFFFFRREFRKFLPSDPKVLLEREPLSNLAKSKELMMFEHKGFWQSMDTLRDRLHLQAIWDSGTAPWVK